MAKLNLPIRNYQICTKTVKDTTDPYIKFDSQGISNFYWDFNKKYKDLWNKKNQNKLKEKIDLIKKRSINKEFDSILGLSGGLDSSYMLHKVVTEYGLRPLVFHVDGGWNSEEATHNINSLIDSLGLDLFTEVINWEEMRDFQLAMFKAGLPNLDVPQDMAFIGILYKFAEKFGIKYILNGGNISTESIRAPYHLLYWVSDMRHTKDILRKFGTVPMNSYPFSGTIYNRFWIPYVKRLKLFKPLNLIIYKKKDAIEELKAIYNWRPLKQKHFESRFTKFFEGYWLPKRFNYDRRRDFYSSLILTGQITRSEALRDLENNPFPLNNDEIKKEFNFIASKLRIPEEELLEYLNMPKKYFWDYKNNSTLLKCGEKFLEFVTGKSRDLI